MRVNDAPAIAPLTVPATIIWRDSASSFEASNAMHKKEHLTSLGKFQPLATGFPMTGGLGYKC
jgi:hypothetical protein